jgi:transmembrane sensor
MSAEPDNSDGKERAAQEATAWFVRLTNPLATDEDRRRFRAWIAADPANAAAFDDVRALWGRLDLPAAKLGRGGWHRKTARSSSLAFRAAAAAALIGLIGAALVWRDPGLFDRLRADYATAPGHRSDVALADGTHLYLDGDSAVRVHLGPESREIALLRGRVFFDVAPDPARPFHVTADAIQTEVLGTGFAVDNETMSVAVEHGSVAVRRPAGARVKLGAGQGVHARGQGLSGIEQLEPEESFSWRRGLIVLDSAPLGNVADELARMKPGRVLIPDSELRALTLSGTFRADDPDAVLEAMRTALGLKTVSVPGLATIVYR